MTAVFIDTNVFIYHLTDNHPEFSPRCSALLGDVEAGRIQAYTAITAIDETFRVLSRTFGISREASGAMFTAILELPSIQIDHRSAVLQSIEFWQRQPPLSFVDCYHLALAAEMGMTQVYSFDKKMDRFSGVERIEPE